MERAAVLRNFSKKMVFELWAQMWPFGESDRVMQYRNPVCKVAVGGDQDAGDEEMFAWMLCPRVRV